MPRFAVKPFLHKAHRWIGVTLTPVFLLIILSGAVLALKPVVEDLAPAPIVQPVDAKALAGLSATLESQGSVRSLTVADNGRAVDVRGDAAVAGRWDLATGEKTPAAQQSLDIFAIALQVHKSLFVGLGALVDVASWAMLAMMLAAPFMVWLRFRNTLMGWHLALGWCLLPVSIIPPLTAVMMTLGIGMSGTPLPQSARPVAVSEALTRAAATTDLRSLEMVRSFRGGTVLMVTANGATAVSDTKVVPLGSSTNIVKAIHEGTWAGAWSGILNFASAMVLFVLTVSGFWSWFRRWRRDRRTVKTTGNAKVLVTYASQTGTAARLAAATVKALESLGERCVLAPLGAVAPGEFGRFGTVLLAAATTGNGDVPDSARRFLGALKPGVLAGSNFALLGLGDRRYRKFCGGAETLRQAMLDAGAAEIVPFAKADGEPGGVWSAWLGAVSAKLGLKGSVPAAPLADDTVMLTLAERTRLDDPARGDTQETWSIVLESETPLDFRPGDLLRIRPAAGERERSYSIGSSSRVDPRRIELTVRLHAWADEAGNRGLGRMSAKLTGTLPPGTRLSARIAAHTGFNPPSDPRWPVIMIGCGTGVAPYPGFLAERLASGRPGPAWLLFGNRHRDADFLWRARFEAALADGSLTRLNTAFSRDPLDGAYVQDRLLTEKDELARWLIEDEAVVYLCGRRQMTRDVLAALATTLTGRNGLTAATATEEIDRWVAEGRIRIDAFD